MLLSILNLLRRLPVVRSALLVFFLILTAGFPPAYSQGDLLITPRRVVFEGSMRSVDLNLANIGKDSARYAISLVQIRMNENGTFETITEPDPGQRFADRNLRYFPRSVNLGPNESQVVKVQLTRQNQLSQGEYRSHFYFRAIPMETPLGEAEIVQDTSTISIVLKPVFGITIPVIIRVGESTTRVTISDLSLKRNKDQQVLSLVLNRTGNMSVYGDLAVDHISPAGTVTRVGIANGVAVYTPNPRRVFSLILSGTENIDLGSGKLRVSFSAPSDVKPEKYAGAELVLN